MTNKTNYFIHPSAICESKSVGAGTRIWAFVHVLPGAVVGANCNICDHVFIENDVKIGNNATIKSGVQLWDGVTLEDEVFVGPNATFVNDLFPRSKRRPDEFSRTTINQGASIGANATILAGISIGRFAMVGAGSVVTQDVPPHAVVAGNPARIINYCGSNDNGSGLRLVAGPVGKETESNIGNDNVPLGVGESSLRYLPSFQDMRGSLVVAEFAENLPFIPRRAFYVHSVPSRKVRGEHAQKTCAQFLIAVHGSLCVIVDDGVEQREVFLDRPCVGLCLPCLIWAVQFKFSHDAVLAVYASHPYDENDYVRDYGEFISLVKNRGV